MTIATLRRKPRVVLAFGASCSPWILPMYRALRDDFDISVLSTHPTVAGDDIVRIYGIRSIGEFLPGTLDRLFSWGLGRVLPTVDYVPFLGRKLADADIVHSIEIHSPLSYQIARRKTRFSFRHVCTVWENIANRMSNRPDVAHVKRTVLKSVDKLIAVSERARTALLLDGAHERRIVVIPPGVSYGPSSRLSVNGIRQQTTAKQREFRLLFVGNKQRSKGVEDLLNAFALLLRDPDLTGSRLSITCVGVKPSVGPYAWLVSRYQLGAYLMEIAEVPHERVFDYYRECDVLVLPSRVTPLWQEQFGMVLAEAMGNGLPIVSTHSGSISEVTEDAALYAKPNDHHSLFCALKRLALDDRLRARLSAAGAARAQMYEISRVANRLASVYREVLESALGSTQ